MTDRLPPESAKQAYRQILLDPGLIDLREAYSRAVARSLATVAGWLALDSFLGGGDAPLPGAPRRVEATSDMNDEERYTAFRAAAGVIEMAAELMAGAVQMLDSRLTYAASALVRQVIETEYLLTAFATDFALAMRWARASPDEIRREFTPKTMRTLGGFSNHEYWTHCDLGGHPAPQGRLLLRGLHAPTGEEATVAISVWADLAQHGRRLWGSADRVLTAQHPRYAKVRFTEIAAVAVADRAWTDVDPLADPVNIARMIHHDDANPITFGQ